MQSKDAIQFCSFVWTQSLKILKWTLKNVSSYIVTETEINKIIMLSNNGVDKMFSFAIE